MAVKCTFSEEFTIPYAVVELIALSRTVLATMHFTMPSSKIAMISVRYSSVKASK
jgi:hypothetical protein